MAKSVNKFLQLGFPQVSMSSPPSHNLHEDPNPMTFLQKLLGVLQPIKQVVLAHLRGQANFLQFLLMLSGFLLLLPLLILELAVVHDAADRRAGVGGNLNQVQAFGASQSYGVPCVHDTEFLTVLVNDQYLRDANLLVYPKFPALLVSDVRSPPKKILPSI